MAPSRAQTLRDCAESLDSIVQTLDDVLDTLEELDIYTDDLKAIQHRAELRATVLRGIAHDADRGAS